MPSENNVKIPNFTKKDFLETKKPYEFVNHYRNDPFEEFKVFLQVNQQAEHQGASHFSVAYSKYKNSLEMTEESKKPDKYKRIAEKIAGLLESEKCTINESHDILHEVKSIIGGSIFIAKKD